MPDITMKLIAMRLGVSLSTVSKALNGYPDISEETRQRILQAAQQMGYSSKTMLQSLTIDAPNVIGLVLPDIITPVYMEIYSYINETARKNGINIFLCDSNRSEELEKAYVTNLMASKVIGIIIAPVSDHIEPIMNLVNGRIPVVYIGGKVDARNASLVSSNNFEGGRMIADYLVSLGHKDITIINNNENSIVNRKRIDGFLDVMRKNNLKPNIIVNRNQALDVKRSGYLISSELIKKPLPSAIFVVQDMMAVGVIQALVRNGIKIPEDVSIVGYDDIAIASSPTFSLTTIAQPKKEMAEMALRMILEMAVDKKKDNTVQLAHPKLVVRKSCRAIDE